VLENHSRLDPKVYNLPYELDCKVAALKIKAMGISIDALSPEQAEYLSKA